MDSRIKSLSKYRYDRSVEELDNAKALYNDKRYKLSLNRCYYSIFYGMRAVIVLDNYDSSKHSGVISQFNHNYVKTSIFPKKVSQVIKSASAMRESADYEDFFIVSLQDVNEQLASAEYFNILIKEYLISRNIL